MIAFSWECKGLGLHQKATKKHMESAKKVPPATLEARMARKTPEWAARHGRPDAEPRDKSPVHTFLSRNDGQHNLTRRLTLAQLRANKHKLRTSSQLPFAGLGCVHVGIASSSPSSEGYCPIDRRFASLLFEPVRFCIDDGGALLFAFFAEDDGVDTAGLFARRFAVGVEGVEALPADSVGETTGEERPCVRIWDVARGSSANAASDDDGSDEQLVCNTRSCPQ